MIKLKSLIEHIAEAKKFDMDNVNDAAEYLIRATWKYMPKNDTVDLYDNHQVFLWIDNELPLQRQKEKFAEKFFPSEKYPEDKFCDVISSELEKLEKLYHSRMIKRINSNDPLFILKKIVRGRKYENAKRELCKNSLGSWGYEGEKVDDDHAEEIFNRIYRNAMGETVYDSAKSKTYGRLSQIHRIPIQGQNEESANQYSINMFIDRFAGYHANKFPDKIKVYRGVNTPSATIRPGDFVTFDKGYASGYIRGKFGSIINCILNSKDLYVYEVDLSRPEMVYWPEGHKIKKYEGEVPTFKQFWHEINYEGV